MNGSHLTLGVVAALAAVGLVRQHRGSRATRQQAQDCGFDAGYSAAKYTDWDPARDFNPAEHDTLLESLVAYAFEAEDQMRGAIPLWEQIAAQFNEGEDPDELWEAYDEGVNKGIKEAAKKRLGLSQRHSIRQARRLITALGLPLEPPDDIEEWNKILIQAGYDEAKKWR